MGLLTEGQPLTWEETKDLADHVRRHGVQQFIHLYRKLEKRRGDVLKWGDEVEYIIVKLDKDQKRALLSLKAEELLSKLQEPEKNGQQDLESLWRPEYGSYMVEGTPGLPYGGSICQFNTVEANMRRRRQEVQALLGPDEKIFSMSCCPRLGCPNFTFPQYEPDPQNSFSRSLFWPNEATFQGHPRFRTLTTNIRQRRKEKVAINIPIYRDTETQDPVVSEAQILAQGESAAKPWHIYMDAMGFGMGLSCLQLTFQACNLVEAERLYDQLAPLCPIMLALSAATPIFRGLLSDVDCRWDIIAASVDCRTKQERGLEPLTTERFVIPKSRYDSISSYLSDCSLKHNYNDVPLVYDQDVYETLKNAGIKELTAKHVAHLFIRDTVSLFSEKIHQNDEEDTDHFENIQSTNWQTMRFKPPPANSEIGWRVEFRPCELQFTDFENAALVCFIVVLTRAILSYGYNLLIPISKVDENMRRAQTRDAVLKQKFHFRTNINATCEATDEPAVQELSVEEILNGDPEKNFPGLIPIVQDYLKNIELDTETGCTLSKYFNFLKLKSSGEYLTNAAFIRQFVQNHPNYKNDSVVSEEITFDLFCEIDNIVQGKSILIDALKQKK